MERKTINPSVLSALRMAASEPKPRFRVPAQSQVIPQPATSDKAFLTKDSFQNFATSLGLGTNNVTSGSTYGFHPLSRNHTKLEWMYRGSWLARKIVDIPADDMIRAGIEMISDETDPAHLEALIAMFRVTDTWNALCTTLKWARLYGGACAYIDIDGQDPASPLRIETIGKGQYKGLIVLDRWMLWPRLSDVVTDAGPNFGKPKYYDVVADGIGLPRMKIHHSRLLRFDGVELPYWQRMQENGWGLSVLEPIYDRLVAFDSATTGVAQLTYRAYLRTYKITGVREIIAAGGEVYNGLVSQINFMRMMQSNEGIAVVDKEDDMEFNSYTFSGLSDVLQNFAMQLCGGADIPMTRLFGQSPGGLNATGDSDLHNYYDSVNSRQESGLRMPITLLLAIAYRSCFGQALPDQFTFNFNSLWQSTDTEKAANAKTITEAIGAASDIGISQQTALKELRASSRRTGVFGQISDEEIKAASDEVPEPGELGDPGAGINAESEPSKSGAAKAKPAQGKPSSG